MTIHKVVKLVEERYRKYGFGTPPDQKVILNIIKAYATLVDGEDDPDCVFINKCQSLFDDLARDVRSAQ